MTRGAARGPPARGQRGSRSLPCLLGARLRQAGGGAGRAGAGGVPKPTGNTPRPGYPAGGGIGHVFCRATVAQTQRRQFEPGAQLECYGTRRGRTTRRQRGFTHGTAVAVRNPCVWHVSAPVCRISWGATNLRITFAGQCRSFLSVHTRENGAHARLVAMHDGCARGTGWWGCLLGRKRNCEGFSKS